MQPWLARKRAQTMASHYCRAGPSASRRAARDAAAKQLPSAVHTAMHTRWRTCGRSRLAPPVRRRPAGRSAAPARLHSRQEGRGAVLWLRRGEQGHQACGPAVLHNSETAPAGWAAECLAACGTAEATLTVEPELAVVHTIAPAHMIAHMVLRAASSCGETGKHAETGQHTLPSTPLLPAAVLHLQPVPSSQLHSAPAAGCPLPSVRNPSACDSGETGCWTNAACLCSPHLVAHVLDPHTRHRPHALQGSRAQGAGPVGQAGCALLDGCVLHACH